MAVVESPKSNAPVQYTVDCGVIEYQGPEKDVADMEYAHQVRLSIISKHKQDHFVVMRADGEEVRVHTSSGYEAYNFTVRVIISKKAARALGESQVDAAVTQAVADKVQDAVVGLAEMFGVDVISDVSLESKGR